jgi:hypothetical protein
MRCISYTTDMNTEVYVIQWSYYRHVKKDREIIAGNLFIYIHFNRKDY